jgi:hypothetical protein
MAIQSTPHTKTQQNTDAAQSDLEPDQIAQDEGRGDDAALYQNAEGAQTGDNRAFHRNQSEGHKHNTEPESVAHVGTVTSRTPQSENQGITNHSASEESARQEKVVSQREDAQAGVNHSRS